MTALPGPRGRWLLGNLGDFQRDQLGFYADCARYGDVVATRLGPRRALLFYHPDAIEDVLVAKSRDFVKSPGVRLLRPLLGDGLLLSEHDFWLRQRRLVQPAFHRQRVVAYGEVMTADASGGSPAEKRATSSGSPWRGAPARSGGAVRDLAGGGAASAARAETRRPHPA